MNSGLAENLQMIPQFHTRSALAYLCAQPKPSVCSLPSSPSITLIPYTILSLFPPFSPSFSPECDMFVELVEVVI